MSTRTIIPALALSALLLGGCASTLPTVATTRPLADAWTEAPATPPTEGAAEGAAAADQWWLAFGDPLLDRLIAMVPQSDDVALAQARYNQALAQLRAARAALRPTLDATAKGTGLRVDDLEQDQAQSVLQLGWTPDLNGAGNARRRAALSRAEAEQARMVAVRQATRATAARLYFAWREGLARAAAERDVIAALDATARLATSRRKAGLVSDLDPVAALASRDSASARLPAALEAADTARLALEALLGMAPGTMKDQGSTAVPQPAMRPVLDAPMAVMARRPDLRAAELDLRAAGYSAQAARRAFWPSISLGAALGYQGVQQENPFLVSGPLGQLTGSLLAPLISAGRLEAARDNADAARTEAAVRYRQAATRAASEVETALMAMQQVDARRTALDNALASSVRRTKLAESRYRAGLSPLLDVLTARQAQASIAADRASAQADAARAYAALAVALGLGTG